MKQLLFVVVSLCAAALAACGGGGGGGGSSSVAPPTVAPPAATSTPPTQLQAVTGTVVDYTSGAAIADATVIAGTTLVIGATAPPSIPAGDATATTSATGAFTIGLSQNGPGYIMVFAPDGHITFHGVATYATNQVTTYGPIKLSTPTSDDLAWLSAINTDRASYGDAPVIFDELLMEATRLWGNYEAANGRGGDTDPLAPPPYTSSIAVFGSLVKALNGGSLGSFNIALAQNQGGGTSGPSAEADFRSEGPTGSHFSTIIAPAAKWIGTSRDACQGSAAAACSIPDLQFTLDLMAPPSGV